MNYRDMVNIQKDASAEGQLDPSYTATLYAKVPCKVVIVSGDETYRGRQLEPHLSHVVELFYMNGIKPDMRLKVIGGTTVGSTLNIAYVKVLDHDGRKKKLELYCRELVAV